MRCEHFDYSELRAMFPIEQSPCVQEEYPHIDTTIQTALVRDVQSQISMGFGMTEV